MDLQYLINIFEKILRVVHESYNYIDTFFILS